jgi:hypothetical protein
LKKVCVPPIKQTKFIAEVDLEKVPPMTQLPANVLTANRIGDRYFITVRIGREKSPGISNAKVRSEFEHSVVLPRTSDVLRRFNRDTERLAALVVSAVVSAALVFAALVPDRRPRAADLTEEATEAGGYLLRNANLRATPFEVVGLNGKRITGETPARLEQLNPGSNTIHLRSGGPLDWQTGRFATSD